MFIAEPLISSKQKNILSHPLGNEHLLAISNAMRLAAMWKISGKIWHSQEFQRLLPTLTPELGKSQLRRVINRPGESGLAGVVGQKSIHFGVI